jgi:hypothetical protein
MRQAVLQSSEVGQAMAVGLFRPLVLVPASWIVEMPPDVLEAVIAHELAHLARRDVWINFLQRLVETLLFYHPAVWWLSAQLRQERELCADELAIELTGKRLDYARALQQVASERQADIRPALAAFVKGASKMRLLERIQHVLGQHSSQRSRLWPAGLVALALPAFLWLAAAIAGSAIADDVRDDRDDRKERRQTVIKRDRDDDRQESRDRESRDKENDKDKRAAIETRVERFVLRKDGQEPQEVERRTVLKDGKPVTVVEIGKGDERKVSSDRRIDELTVLVKRLTAQVEQLQDQVQALRGAKQDLSETAPDRAKRRAVLDIEGRQPTPEELAADKQRLALDFQVRVDDVKRAVKEKI